MSFIIYNGKIIPSQHECIPYNDRGLTLGDGFFETILIKKGKIPLFKYHWRRLKQSATWLQIPLPFNEMHLEAMILDLIECNNLQETIAGARLTITSGLSDRGILSSSIVKPNFIIFVFEPIHQNFSNYSATTVSIKKNEHSLTSKIKSISYLDNILAKKEAVHLGYHEAILLNTTGKIADGATSTIYRIKDNKIFTPPIEDGALPGVIRSVLLEEFNHVFPIQEKSLTLSELLNADELFISNALIGIQPIYKFNNKEFNDFSVTSTLNDAFCTSSLR